MHAGVVAEHFPGRRDQLALLVPAGVFRRGQTLLQAIGFDELRVIAGGNEADLLAFRLFGDRQPRPARDFADFLLGRLAQREARARHLLLRQAEQEIGLILGGIDGAQQLIAA